MLDARPPTVALAICLAALVVGASLRLAAVLDARHLDRLADDAFISLSVARSIGEGRGFRSSETVTSSFQPLYVLLAAPIYAVLRPAAPAELDRAARLALLVPVAADLAALALLAFLLGRAAGPVAACVGASVWAVHPGAVGFATNGLETSVWLACLLAVVAWHEYGPDVRHRDAVTGALVGLAALARVDALFLAVAVALVVLWEHRKQSPAVPLARLARMTAGGAVVYGPWLAVLYWQTGDLVPASGAATLWIGEQLRAIATAEGSSYTRFMAGEARDAAGFRAPVVAVSALLLVPLARTRALRLLALTLLPLACFYTLVHGLWYYLARYLAPLAVLEVAAMAVGVAALWRWRRAAGAWVASIAACSCLAGLPAVVAAPAPDWTYRPHALAALSVVPEGATVGAPESGAVAYYLAGRDVVNLDGVVDPAALRALDAERMERFVRERGVGVIVSARQGASLVARRSRGLRLERQTDLGGVDRPWYVWRVVP